MLNDMYRVKHMVEYLVVSWLSLARCVAMQGDMQGKHGGILLGVILGFVAAT